MPLDTGARFKARRSGSVNGGASDPVASVRCYEAFVPLSIGQEAPPFERSAGNGQTIKLEDYRGKKNVVLYFYPKDFTSVCTAEACGFRDMYEELVGKDTEVIGVSMDSGETHGKFSKSLALPFPLLSDPDRSLAQLYKATGILTALIGRVNRVTYVIDKQGKIRGVFESEVRASKHLEGVKQLVSSL